MSKDDFGRPGKPPYSGAETVVREKLITTPGARGCDREGCNVITQGGQRGWLEHLRVVHGQG